MLYVLSFSFFFLSSRFCVYVYPVWVYVHHVHTANWGGQKIVSVSAPCVLETDLGSLRRATSALDMWAVCPSPCFGFLECLTFYIRLVWSCCCSPSVFWAPGLQLHSPCPSQRNFLFQPFVVVPLFSFCPFLLVILLSYIAEAGVEVLSSWFTCPVYILSTLRFRLSVYNKEQIETLNCALGEA